MKRQGLGKGLGMGYKNIAPLDSHIHSLSAKGQKTKSLYMMGLQDIKRANREACEVAQRENREPFVASKLTSFENMRMMPNFGDYRPKGWELVETHFVDSSGFGRPNEPAMTINEFMKKVKSGRGYAIIEAGQFQIYVGEFKKTRSFNAKGKKKRNPYGNPEWESERQAELEYMKKTYGYDDYGGYEGEE